VAAAVPSAHRAGRGSHGAHRPAALICAQKSPVPARERSAAAWRAGARRRCGRPRSRSYSCGTDLTPAQATADGWVSARHDSVAVSRGGQVGEDETVESLARLREQRMFSCRLSDDRALGSVEEADAFLRDRGLLTRTADCALPSLYEACHEDPYRPGSPGFATWPATKWPWFGELAGRGHLIAAVHRGKSLLISGAVARLVDPICRAEITRMRAADRGWGRLLDHLAAAGPSSIEDLRAELGLKRQQLKALRAPLERCGAIVSRSPHVTAGQEIQHSSELARWDQAYQGSGGGTGEDPVAAFRDLIAAAVRAAVLAPETELRRWFSWPWYWADSLVDDLIGHGRLRRIDGHVTVASRSRPREAPQRPATSRNPA
jgi:hypothetical protein